jgi:hypothetical protein
MPINLYEWVVGLLTGHCHLKGHLLKLGLSDSPTFERCQEENETATHILCECETLACLTLSLITTAHTMSSVYYSASLTIAR